MLRSLFAASLIWSTAVAAGSGQEWARKMFETTSHDFGVVARGAKAEYRFVLQNLYKEDIHLAGVRSSCGCTSPTITNDLLKTWEKSAILATFNTRTFQGQRRATLTVTIDQPFYAEVQLQVTGYIRSDVVLHPGGVDFGTVDSGAEAEKTIQINYRGRSDWAITAISSPSEYVEAEAVETSRHGDQVGYDLTVRLKPSAPPGYVSQQLILQTNDRRATQFPVDVEGRVISELTVSPSWLSLGSLRPGDHVTRQVVVQARRPFRITGITCDGRRFEFKTPQAAKPVHLVPVSFTAGDEPGKVTYKIRIETDMGEDIVAELSANAEVLPPEPAPTDEGGATDDGGTTAPEDDATADE